MNCIDHNTITKNGFLFGRFTNLIDSNYIDEIYSLTTFTLIAFFDGGV
jgi:hypothetical protein